VFYIIIIPKYALHHYNSKSVIFARMFHTKTQAAEMKLCSAVKVPEHA